MINLYEYHSKPNSLEQYENRVAIIPRLAYNYAIETKQRFEAGEPAIMKIPYNALWYALYVIKCRWPEAEPAIMKDPWFAYLYAENIIQGRWEAGETAIMKDSLGAYEYAVNIIKDRWREAEPTIMKDPGYWRWYKKHFQIQE